ncbi:MAG: hypothetical protein HY815_01290 [Candidatus Riflebacteria bacterium]|nr:hypothetical protein [Candidatus Riflebacteria bacterium]
MVWASAWLLLLPTCARCEESRIRLEVTGTWVDGRGVRAVRSIPGGALFGATPGVLFGRSRSSSRFEPVWSWTAGALDGPIGRSPVPLGGIRALTESGQGELWVATDRGVARVRERPGAGFEAQFVHLEELRTDPVDRIARTGVRALAVDRGSTVWAGTPRGVLRVDPGGNRWYTTEDGLPSCDVTALDVDSSGRLWAMCRAGRELALARFDAVGFQAVPLDASGVDTSELEAMALTFAFAAGGRLFVGPCAGSNGALVRLPVRDRLAFGPGLRSGQVAGLRRLGNDVVIWYGTAATGLTLWGSGSFRDLLTSHHVHDVHQGVDRSVWAATDHGIVAIEPSEPRSFRRLELPEFAPGNALDGVFVHQGSVHVYGPRGLFRLELPEPATRSSPEGEAAGGLGGGMSGAKGPPSGTIPSGSAAEPATRSSAGIRFSPLALTAVRQALPTPRGLAMLSGATVHTLPTGTAAAGFVPAAIHRFAATDDGRLYLATPGALYSAAPGRPNVAFELLLPAAPVAFVRAPGALLMGFSGRPGALWVARTGSATAPGLTVERLPVGARSFLVDGSRILVGTDDGLANLEEGGARWFYHRPGLTVTALARIGPWYFLATDAAARPGGGGARTSRPPWTPMGLPGGGRRAARGGGEP